MKRKRYTKLQVRYRRNPEAVRAEIEEVLTRYGGNIARTAHELDVGRMAFYQMLWREPDTLWPMVDRIRAAALERIAAQRLLLTGEHHGPR